jgi:hypothetical protein
VKEAIVALSRVAAAATDQERKLAAQDALNLFHEAKEVLEVLAEVVSSADEANAEGMPSLFALIGMLIDECVACRGNHN